MPKKPQHLSLASASSGGGGGNTANKPKYSLTLHNNKYATNGGKSGTAMRDNQQQQQQRQHLKALRLTRDASNTDINDYKRPMLSNLSPAEDVGIHLSRNLTLKAAAVNGEASTTTTTTATATATKLTGNGNGSAANTATPMANGVMRTQNNRLWYH
ncbi:hypothetical protein KR093_011155 [Drosophila rubida]|uniref:Uncharacterized protein n=1 Tax=Drosophila rubida TaxID=30044 RepID=A0AAD4K954_9MUSC|nr:hypothetical protein KR093_011155 [Drosophila rubida]